MAALTRISGDGQVALRYGLEEAIFLDALIFWYRTNRGDGRNFRDGRWWSHNSIKAYEEVFPWWSAKQVRRIIDSCKAKGAVLAGNYNQDRRDRTFWYSPSDEVLALYGEPAPTQDEAETGKCNCPNGQMQVAEGADSFAQTGTPLPCTTHDIPPYSPPTGDEQPDLTQQEAKPEPKPKSRKPRTEPAYHPDWFDRFWALYPRRTNRVAAVRAWDKLKPDLDLCRVMKVAIKAQMQTAQWLDGPEHIPHPATWLNGARWLDEVTIPSPGGPPEPEVRNGLR